MNKTKAVISYILCAAAFFFISVFGTAKLISSRILQAAVTGILAAILWFAFVRRISKNMKKEKGDKK